MAYVHSAFPNFSGNINALTASPDFSQFEGASGAVNDRLTQVEDQLKAATESFLGGISIEELNQMLFGPADLSNPYSPASVMIKVIRNTTSDLDRIFIGGTPLSQEKVEAVLGREMAEQLANNFITAENLGSDLVRKIAVKGITDSEINFTQKSSFSIQQVLDALKNLEVELPTEILNNLAAQTGRSGGFSEIRAGKGMTDYFKKALKDYSQAVFTYGFPNIRTTLIEAFKKEWEKSIHDLNYTNQVYAQLEGPFMESLKTGLEKSPKVTTDPNLSGFLGEEFWASVINTLHVSSSSQSASGIEITLEGTGSMSETAARANTQLSEESQKIIQKYGERFTWASSSTSANADIIMTFNGKQARVQSKYERAEVQKLLKKKGGSQTFGTNIIGAKDKQPILEFIQNAAGSGVNLVNMSQEQMGYTIANAIWFDMVDSIEHDQFVSRRTNALDILNAFVGTIVGNFIGLNLAQEEDTIYVVPEYSTLFYNIGNMRLIPTYEIVEGIRQQLFEGQLKTKAYLSNSNGKLANIVTSFTANNSTAKDLLEDKRNLADVSEGESYINTNARSVGETMGENILKATQVKSKIQVNIEMLSSYLFKDE